MRRRKINQMKSIIKGEISDIENNPDNLDYKLLAINIKYVYNQIDKVSYQEGDDIYNIELSQSSSSESSDDNYKNLLWALDSIEDAMNYCEQKDNINMQNSLKIALGFLDFLV